MRLIADLHIHSHYARATSRDLTLENLEKYARLKGLGLLGTGDFQHPKWRQEIKANLKEDSGGILWSASGFPFLWQTEIGLIYSQGGSVRRVHMLILAPSGDVAEQVCEALLKKGRLDYDGRPVFGMSSIGLADMLMGISRDIELIPAHAWTPWFSVFGSNSGFNSLKECFQDRVNFIHAIETGLSSDPSMNWRVSELDSMALISNSDCHSHWPWRIGREANIFDVKGITYKAIVGSIRDKKLVGTIEVDPGYGKYHYDGHRACNVCLSPVESMKFNSICPQCKRKLTIGVLNRVEQLADRPQGFKPKDAAPFLSLIPLSEIIAMCIGSPVASKKTWKAFDALVGKFGNELNVMLDVPFAELVKVTDERIATAVISNRAGRISVSPGFDGEYGKPLLENQKKFEGQEQLGAFL